MTEGQRWVLDTKLLVSRLLAPGGTAAQAVDRALRSGVLLVSEATLSELAEVLARPRFDPYVSPAERQHFLRLLGGVARVVHVTQRMQACRDPKDDKFLDVALHGQAHAIVTGDKDLLALHPFHGVPILTAVQFLALT
ncbi:MAG: putative toxin-antitoxin system toxin component, PIN family [Pseudomonadota bacterium]|nr:putative toxin-antitoxin system toxin component, PIN family [Pseudomonadota bacterium]